MMTSWIMQLTFVCVVLALYNSSLAASGAEEISCRRLACTHILFEITTMMAVLGLSVYWTMLHARNMEY